MSKSPPLPPADRLGLPIDPPDAIARIAAAEDTLRAVAAGEIDAFIVSDGTEGPRVFSLSTADRPYRIFVENMREGAATLSPDGTILFANRRLAELLSRPKETIVGSQLATFLAGDAPVGLHEMGGASQAGTTTEIDLIDADGLLVPVLVGISPLDIDGDHFTCLTFTDLRVQRAQDREIAGLEAQAEDERAQVRAEREMAEARHRQSERLESLGQLAGGVAHDFNNLLGAMQGYVGFVKDEVDAAAGEGSERWVAVAADLGQIQRSIGRASSLTHQLLAFARCEIVHPQILNINDVVVDVEQLLKRTLGGQVDLVSRLEPDGLAVLADCGQLEQVLVNLAVNARDAMPGGGTLTIDTDGIDIDNASARGRPGLRPGPYVRLRVSDTGSGMSQGAIDRAFEPFFTTKPTGHGTGLGLATVYGIISQAGGHTLIHSRPGIGTTITVLLPSSKENAAPKVASLATPQLRGHETVLVVEDEDALREVTRRVLAGRGYHVLAAANGVEALELAANHDGDIDLLLTDLVMPGMLGKEIAEKVLALRPATAVLYVSGYSRGVLGQTLDPGVVLIEKPIPAATLLEAVREALKR
jgi:signal transduction histidine kinase/CheY-like chemotaxis protein